MVEPSFKIDGVEIGEGHPPYVVAELSANHNGSIEKAKTIMQKAKESGASAVKLQTYKPDTLTLDCTKEDFQIQEGLWKGMTLYELYDFAQTPWEWHEELFNYAKKLGITVFSSPFDESAVDLLESLNCPAYKIASFELVDVDLIKYVATKGKPMIMSTGMANKEEIKLAVDTAREHGCRDLALLHCVSGYPASSSDYNLKTMLDMKKSFGLVCGLSDHTLTNVTATTSIALGASIIEKHVTLDREGGGADDSFSLEPRDLKQLCEDSLEAWKAIGHVNYDRKASEKDNVKFRRSLYFVKNVAKGERIKECHVRSVRPGYGLSPKHKTEVVGRVASRNIFFGERVSLNDVIA